MSKNINVKFDGVGCLIAVLIIFFIMLFGGIKIVIHSDNSPEKSALRLEFARKIT